MEEAGALETGTLETETWPEGVPGTVVVVYAVDVDLHLA